MGSHGRTRVYSRDKECTGHTVDPASQTNTYRQTHSTFSQITTSVIALTNTSPGHNQCSHIIKPSVKHFLNKHNCMSDQLRNIRSQTVQIRKGSSQVTKISKYGRPKYENMSSNLLIAVFQIAIIYGVYINICGF